MLHSTRSRFPGAWRWSGLTAILTAIFCVAGPRHGQDAVADGDTRTLSLYHTHTKESAVITFMRDGVYDPAALEKLNWLLRDWRKDEPIRMDPHLFDLVWAAYREVGSQEPIQVVSAYRSPGTNAMLRRRSSAVAKHSQHMAGRAMDFHLTDVSMAKVREVGLRLQRGGVGYYPTAGTPFVHLDTGTVRHWPRVTREYLTRLFPDGKTVHIPADGHPLAHYAEAAAEIEARGGSTIALADINSGGGKSFWQRLFGSEEEDEAPAAPVRGRRGRTVVASAAPVTPVPAGQDDAGVRTFLMQSAAPQQRAAASVAPIPSDQLRAEPAQPPAAAVVAAPAAIAPIPAPAAPDAAPIAVPLPPQRPTLLASLGGQQPEPGQGFALASVPIPPARPPGGELLASPSQVDVPLPPVRPSLVVALAAPQPAPSQPAPSQPAALPASGLPSAIVGDLRQLPAGLNAYATASNIPLPPSRRPVVTAMLTPAAPDETAAAARAPKPEAPRRTESAATEYGVKLDRAGMAALLSRVASGNDRPATPLKVSPPSVQVATAGGVTAGRFHNARPATVAPGRFEGPVIRPLGARVLRPTGN